MVCERLTFCPIFVAQKRAILRGKSFKWACGVGREAELGSVGAPTSRGSSAFYLLCSAFHCESVLGGLQGF
jgi:hypothetical protein